MVIWKQVVGYEDKYLVSINGEIKSIARNKILTPKNNWDGYKRIQLYRKNKCIFVSIHRLVAEAFLGTPQEGMVVNHINGIKGDNRLINLEWVTQKDNIRHAHETGLSKTKKIVHQYDMNNKYIETFDSVSKASKITGVDTSSISRNCNGHLPHAGFYLWRYEETSRD